MGKAENAWTGGNHSRANSLFAHCSDTLARAWSTAYDGLCLSIVSLLLFVVTAHPAAADVQYVYDELGRLVEVVAPSGASARYRYDAAGNIIGIQRSAAGALSIAEFTPNAGPVGTTVTIRGFTR